MKSPLKLVTIILSSVLTLTTATAVVGVVNSYTKEETDSLVLELQTAINTNKTELNGAITTLQTNYNQKITETNDLLATISNANTTQDQKIVELANKVTALENATRITNVAFADNGDLIITFGDGSTQTIQAPPKNTNTLMATGRYIASRQKKTKFHLGFAYPVNK